MRGPHDRADLLRTEAAPLLARWQNAPGDESAEQLVSKLQNAQPSWRSTSTRRKRAPCRWWPKRSQPLNGQQSASTVDPNPESGARARSAGTTTRQRPRPIHRDERPAMTNHLRGQLLRRILALINHDARPMRFATRAPFLHPTGRRRVFPPALLAVGISMLALAACGNGGSPGASGASTTSAPAPTDRGNTPMSVIDVTTGSVSEFCQAESEYSKTSRSASLGTEQLKSLGAHLVAVAPSDIVDAVRTAVASTEKSFQIAQQQGAQAAVQYLQSDKAGLHAGAEIATWGASTVLDPTGPARPAHDGLNVEPPSGTARRWRMVRGSASAGPTWTGLCRPPARRDGRRQHRPLQDWPGPRAPG